MDSVRQAGQNSKKALYNIFQELQNEVKKEYINCTQNLINSRVTCVDTVSTSAQAFGQKYANLEVTSRDKMDIIRVNRPDKKNAITLQMYADLATILSETSKTENAITVITGTGDYYSSGNDLKNLMNADPSNVNEAISHACQLVENLVAAVIDYPKPLVAAVNGHAIGVMVTLLALCDGVYATEKATFYTPFTLLGQNAEACSTYTFPRLMGHSLAADIILFGNKISAAEAHRRGLVSKVYPDNLFESDVWPELARIAALPKGSMRDSKRIIRDIDREILHQTNRRELELLKVRCQSEECINAVLSFLQRKSQL